MPAKVSPKVVKNQPAFLGLESYSEEQADIFFGRGEEIKSLYKLVKANTLTILFGKSGTGKTSLLNAGVFPKLRAGYCLPFRIRLEFLDSSPGLVTQIKMVLKAEIDKYKFQVESYPGDETLWEYFHKEPLWTVVTPILIFDQFEEIFTLASKSARFKKQELDTLIEELSDLIENSIPEKIKERFLNSQQEDNFNYHKQKAKIIFSFREDFLPEIESITAKIPSAKNSRFRLKQMTGSQAYEVITKTWGNAINDAEAKKIVYFLTNEPEGDPAEGQTFESIEVEPSLLSQVCSFIDKQRKSEGHTKITALFLQTYSKEKILRTLYDEVLDESEAALPPALRNRKETADKLPPINPVKVFIEDRLITDEGYRIKYDMQEIEPELRPGIDVVKRKYFIREEGDSIELTHDVIVALVKVDREERRKLLALAEEKRRAKRKMRTIVGFASAALLLIWIILTVPAFVTKVSLENDQANLKDSIRLLRAEGEKLKKDGANTAGRKGKGAPGKTAGLPPPASDNVAVAADPSATTNTKSHADSIRAARRQRYLAGLAEREAKNRLLQDKQLLLDKQLELVALQKKKNEDEQKALAEKERELEQRDKQPPQPPLPPGGYKIIKIAPQPLISTKPPRQQKTKMYGYGYDYAVDSTKLSQ